MSVPSGAGSASVDASCWQPTSNSIHDKGSARDECAVFIREVLEFSPNPLLAMEVQRLCEDKGYKRSTVTRAAKLLGVVKERGFDSKWRWRLP